MDGYELRKERKENIKYERSQQELSTVSIIEDCLRQPNTLGLPAFLILDYSCGSLYYRVVIIKAPLQGLCYTVRDAVDRLAAPCINCVMRRGSSDSVCTHSAIPM